MGPLHEVEPVASHVRDWKTDMSDAKLSAVDDGLFVEIQRFLFREAALLDRRDYGAWLALIDRGHAIPRHRRRRARRWSRRRSTTPSSTRT